MFNRSNHALEATESAVTDAEKRFGHDRFQWLAWPQSWGNTACGFGGIAGQAMTEAQTVIASGDDDLVLVYHNGRFAYEVKSPNEAFWVACGQRKLPGAVDWKRERSKYDSATASSKS